MRLPGFWVGRHVLPQVLDFFSQYFHFSPSVSLDIFFQYFYFSPVFGLHIFFQYFPFFHLLLAQIFFFNIFIPHLLLVWIGLLLLLEVPVDILPLIPRPGVGLGGVGLGVGGVLGAVGVAGVRVERLGGTHPHPCVERTTT